MIGSFTTTDIVEIIITLLISMTVHEFMHGFVGYKLGDITARRDGRLSLNPLKHIDPVMTVILPIITLIIFKVPILAAKPVPFDPRNVKYGEFGVAMLAAAGPLSNLVLAFIAAVVLQHVNVGLFMANFLELFVFYNVIMFVFNLIPIPPLDGSRILYAFSPEALQEVMQRIEPMGMFIVIALVLVGGLNILTSIYNLVFRALGVV